MLYNFEIFFQSLNYGYIFNVGSYIPHYVSNPYNFFTYFFFKKKNASTANSLDKCQYLFLNSDKKTRVFLSAVSSIDDFYYYKLVKNSTHIAPFNKELMNYEQKIFKKTKNKMSNLYYNKIEDYFFDYDDDGDIAYYQKKHQPFLLGKADFSLKNLLLQNVTFFNFTAIKFWIFLELFFGHWSVLFFFNRIKIAQTLEKFWYICHIWEWNFLMEDSLFWGQKSKVSKHLNKISNKQESKKGMQLFIKFLMYKSKTNSYVLSNFMDIQVFAFDKNFFFLWNYRTPYKGYFNLYLKSRVLPLKYIYKNRLLLPIIQHPSNFTSIKTPLSYYRSWEWNLSVFPELALQSDRNNSILDFFTAGYSRFFKGGETYLDSLALLERQWYKATIINHGSYDSIVGDFGCYQASYMTSNVAATRFALETLILRNYESPNDFQWFINNYSSVFRFKTYKTYKWHLKSSILFSINPLERLKLFWDFIAIDETMQSTERLMAVFFGYNKSVWMYHSPKWGASIGSSIDFYLQILCNASEDRRREELDWTTIEYMSDYFYQSKLNLSLFVRDQFNVTYLSGLLMYINERIHNDPGYYYSFFNSTYITSKKIIYTIVRFLDVFYSQVLPAKNYSWNLFYNFNYYTSWNTLIDETKPIIGFFWNFIYNLRIKPLKIYFNQAVISWCKIRFGGSQHFNNPIFFIIELPKLSPYLHKLTELFEIINTNFVINPYFYDLYYKLLNNLPVHIKNEFFMWTWPWSKLIYFFNTDKTVNLAVLSKLEIHAVPIPLDFFFFNTRCDSLFININRIEVRNQLIPLDFFLKKIFQDYSDKDLITFLKLWGISKFSDFEEFPFSEEFLIILNSLDFSENKIKNIELQRYYDYILKPKTYKNITS